MKRPATALTVLLFAAYVAVHAQEIDEGARVRKAAEDFFKERGLYMANIMPAPDSQFVFKLTLEPFVAEIAFKRYGDLEAAIVIACVERNLDGTEMTRKQWLRGLREGRKAGMTGIPDDKTLAAQKEQRILIQRMYVAFPAVHNQFGWRVYATDPYFPTVEAELDFNAEKERLLALYRSMTK